MTMPVVDLLARGRAAPPEVSALDAVMGEDWAEIGLGHPRRARPGLAAAHRDDVARYRGMGAPGGWPQAVVKMIRKGGVSDLRGLKAQMAYLSREGERPLQRSERYMGVEVDAEGMVSLERAWRMPAERSGTADRTSHFLVSFPEATPHGDAERAGRAWAERAASSVALIWRAVRCTRDRAATRSIGVKLCETTVSAARSSRSRRPGEVSVG